MPVAFQSRGVTEQQRDRGTAVQTAVDEVSPAPAGAPAPYPLTPDPSKTLWVKLPSERDPLFEHIRLLLTMFPGLGRMIIYCEKEKKRIGTRCIVHEALLAELRELCGEKNVVLK